MVRHAFVSTAEQEMQEQAKFLHVASASWLVFVGFFFYMM